MSTIVQRCGHISGWVYHTLKQYKCGRGDDFIEDHGVKPAQVCRQETAKCVTEVGSCVYVRQGDQRGISHVNGTCLPGRNIERHRG